MLSVSSILKNLWFCAFVPVSALIEQCFGPLWNPKSPNLSKYGSYTLVKLDVKVINNLVKFLGASVTLVVKKTAFLCFWARFCSILTHFWPIWHPKPQISGQIWAICITWVRFQGYQAFSEVLGLQWPQMLKNLWFCDFESIFALFWPILTHFCPKFSISDS